MHMDKTAHIIQCLLLLDYSICCVANTTWPPKGIFVQTTYLERYTSQDRTETDHSNVHTSITNGSPSLSNYTTTSEVPQYSRETDRTPGIVVGVLVLILVLLAACVVVKVACKNSNRCQCEEKIVRDDDPYNHPTEMEDPEKSLPSTTAVASYAFVNGIELTTVKEEETETDDYASLPNNDVEIHQLPPPCGGEPREPKNKIESVSSEQSENTGTSERSSELHSETRVKTISPSEINTKPKAYSNYSD